jgi:hypothetical protein
MQEEFCQPEEVNLEMPHPTIGDAEIDLVIEKVDKTFSAAFEFKYDRHITDEIYLSETQQAGEVLNSVFLLARIPQRVYTGRYFIYVTDQKMATYFQNPKNGLSGFFNLSGDRVLKMDTDFIINNAKALHNVVEDMFVVCSVQGVFSQEISGGHSVRIYKVIR